MADTETHLNSSPVETAESLESKPEDSIQNDFEPPSMREILIGGTGFLIFLTVLVVVMNTIGVEVLQQAFRDAGPLAPIIYITLKAVTYVFAPLTSGPIQIIAAPLFGNIWLGTLYTLTGEVIGGSISFWLARRFGRPLVYRLIGEKGTMQVEKFYQKRINNWLVLAAARLILFSVWDFLSYAMGMAKSVRFSTYVLISTVVGAIPTLFFVWVGSEAIQDTETLLMIYGLVIVLVLIPILLHRPIELVLRWLSKGIVPKDG